MIRILALTAGGEAAAGSRYLFRPGEAQPGALPKAARTWGRCVSLLVAANWYRKFHRRHYQRYGMAAGRLKVHCARCGRKFVRIRELLWRVKWLS
jgi:hypothetical protein